VRLAAFAFGAGWRRSVRCICRLTRPGRPPLEERLPCDPPPVPVPWDAGRGPRGPFEFDEDDIGPRDPVRGPELLLKGARCPLPCEGRPFDGRESEPGPEGRLLLPGAGAGAGDDAIYFITS
jgi:hypothetical protein